MVGVAGRSKACLSCYRRRIRCDETRPVCKRCIKADIECLGYKDTTFVSFGVGQTGPQNLGKNVVLVEQDTPPPGVPSVKGPIMLWASDDMCISYARSCLPRTWRDLSLWLLPVTGRSDSGAFMEENLAQYACISLARTLFAYRFRQGKLLAQGLSLYRAVISTFQRQLSLHDTDVYKRMVKVAIALRAFDSFIPCNPKAWISHSLGIETLFALIGPAACNDDDMRKLLQRARPLVAMACLESQRTTIFAEEQWKVVPWSDCNVRKEDIEHLIDILVDLPDTLFRKTGETQSADLHSIIQNLHRWKSIRLQKSFEFQVNNIETYALYLAVSTIVLHTAFSSILKHKHGERCTLTSISTTRDLLLDQQSTDKLLHHDNILSWYHALLTDACSIARAYAGYKGSSPPPSDILVSLRQVWRMTRNVNCPLAVGFNAAMTQIMGDPAAKLPLFLYAQ